MNIKGCVEVDDLVTVYDHNGLEICTGTVLHVPQATGDTLNIQVEAQNDINRPGLYSIQNYGWVVRG